MQNPTQTRWNIHLTPEQNYNTQHNTLPPVPDDNSVRTHIHKEFTRRSLDSLLSWCPAPRCLRGRVYVGLLAAGATGATPVRPFHTSPLIHAQARTCSGRLLSQSWTGPRRHRSRPPTLPTHITTQNHTRHIFTGAPLDPPSRCEQLFATLGHSPEAHINTRPWVSGIGYPGRSTRGPRSAPHQRPLGLKNIW